MFAQQVVEIEVIGWSNSVSTQKSVELSRYTHMLLMYVWEEFSLLYSGNEG